MLVQNCLPYNKQPQTSSDTIIVIIALFTVYSGNEHATFFKSPVNNHMLRNFYISVVHFVRAERKKGEKSGTLCCKPTILLNWLCPTYQRTAQVAIKKKRTT